VIRLTDPRGKPILIAEHMIVCITDYQPDKSDHELMRTTCKSLVAMVEGRAFVVQEDVEEIDFRMRTGIGGGNAEVGT
jgi:uncharacterized protein YlzI (FlbEa/FlbD family)